MLQNLHLGLVNGWKLPFKVGLQHIYHCAHSLCSSGNRLFKILLQAVVVERYNRPMPKLRNTKPETVGYEERKAPLGTLNAAQLRHIILLHQGKADDHDGPMDVKQIAEKFQIDSTMVQSILQFLSLPPEDSSFKQKRNQQ